MSGQTIAGRYRLLEPLARGPMSSVWLADDEELGRRVAVKTLAPTADPMRFEREARAVASLAHPHICRLYDYGEASGRPYMVLEYLEGGTLEDRLRGGRPLPDDETARVAAEIASGLAHAHARGVVHRDLKPANVLFDGEGRARIADFGIARMGAGGLTEAGTVLGTAAYISPEQAGGEPAGPASDVYSFGAILFRMLTGRLPFVATNAMELVRRNRDEPPPAVASIRPDAPPRLAAVADAALAKSPGDRPGDGAALLAELAGREAAATPVLPAAVLPAQAPDTALTTIRPAVPAGSPRRARRRRSLAGGGLLVVVLAAGAGAAWIATRPGPDPAPAQLPLSLPAVSAGSPVPFVATTALATSAPTTTLPATTLPTSTLLTSTAPAAPPIAPATVPTGPATTATRPALPQATAIATSTATASTVGTGAVPTDTAQTDTVTTAPFLPPTTAPATTTAAAAATSNAATTAVTPPGQ